MMAWEYFYDTPDERGRLYRMGEDDYRFEARGAGLRGVFQGTAEWLALTDDDKRRAIDKRKVK